MAATWGWLSEGHIWKVEYAGVITPKNFRDSASITLDVLSRYKRVVIAFDASDVMITPASIDFQNNFKLIDEIWSHPNVRHLVFVVPGKRDNLAGQIIERRCKRLGITRRSTICEDWQEAQQTLIRFRLRLHEAL